MTLTICICKYVLERCIKVCTFFRKPFHAKLSVTLYDTMLYYLGRLRNKLVQCLPTPCACPTVLWCIAAEMKSVWMINWKTRCVVATPLQQVSTPEHNRHGTAQNHNTKS